jgi:hypothetical protein
MTETDRVARGLIDRTLPKPQWTHEAHLRAGLWHVFHYGPERALALLRERISSYNESVGTANTDTSGYHETITVFYVKTIDAFLRTANQETPLDDLAAALIATLGDRELPLRYYSKTRLFSVEARRTYVEPDTNP